MITKYENFLEEDLFLNCLEYSKQIYQNRINIESSANLIVERDRITKENINVRYVPILTHKIINTNKSLSEKIISVVKEKLSVSEYNVDPRMYFYRPGSHIAWHNDEHWFATLTIYLVENWDINNGGYFLHKENGEIKAIPPERNLAVFQTEASHHAVTPLTFNSPIRTVIHCFIHK